VFGSHERFDLTLSCAAGAATFEVAQENNQATDNGAGTAEQPWKTIGKAAEKASAGDLVIIRGGVYREHVLIKSSGTAQAPIRFEAAPGEHVVLTGANRLNDWHKTEDTRPIYQAPWPRKFIGWNQNMT